MADFDYQFFIEVLVGGLLSGVMYSLVAIGFVLIYKTSGVLNFAQGSMLLFAALTFVSLVERGIPFVLALAITFAMMVLLGIAIERPVLRPLVNKPPITLFMATLGLSYIIEGAAQLIWGTQVHGLDLGIEDVPFDVGGVLISQFDLFAAVVAATMVRCCRVLPVHPHRASPSAPSPTTSSPLWRLGCGCHAPGPRLDRRRLRRPGRRAALGRSPWRAVLAVTRGAEGTPGAGARRIRFHPRRDRRRTLDRRQREARRGLYRRLFRRRYRELVRLRRGARLPACPSLRPVRPEACGEGLSHGRDHNRVFVHAGPAEMDRAGAAAAFAYGVIPLIGSSYLFEAILLPFLALSLAGVGLNILTGYAGQLSLGSAAFMAIGAFAAYNFDLRVPACRWSQPYPGGRYRRGGGSRLRSAQLAPRRVFISRSPRWPRSFLCNGRLTNSAGFQLLAVRRRRRAAAVSLSATLRRRRRQAIFRAHCRRHSHLPSPFASGASQTGRNFIAIRDNEIAARSSAFRY